MANRTTLVPDKTAKASRKPASPNGNSHAERERIFALFRRWGFYESTLDPLGFFAPLKFPDLQGLSGEFAEEARRYYCGTIGVEFEHLPEPERRRWIAERMEGPEFEVNQGKILERLIRADLFEQVLQSRYLGSKRFSLEGNTSLIPLLDSILDTAGDRGGSDSIVAMSHRGRLNVMTHIACKAPHEVVAGFEDVDHRRVHHFRGQKDQHPPGVESEPPGSRGPGGHGPRTRQADAPWRQGSATRPLQADAE
jgi:2-oxoglutarate dehydrogenase E1 component